MTWTAGYARLSKQKVTSAPTVAVTGNRQLATAYVTNEKITATSKSAITAADTHIA
jgi:hypothetical protein